MDELLDDDFVEYGSSGKVFLKSDVMDASGIGTPYELSDFTFRDLGPEVVLVQYISVVPDQVARRSSIWRKNCDAWQLLHHQATVVPNAT